MNIPLIITSAAFMLLCIFFLIAFIVSLRKRRFMGAVTDLIFAFLMLAVSLLFGVITISIHGYNSFTREELAAYVEIIPIKAQSFTARIILQDGEEKEYILEGDEIYIDAHILKWKSLANLMGIHTLYELDRVAGRYTDIEDETNKKRTVYYLGEKRLIDIFKLRLQYPFLSFLVDAEYGSATFVAVNKHRKINVMVSTTGLIIRDAEN